MSDKNANGAAKSAAPTKGESKKADPKEVATSVGANVIWENDKGEFFTLENLALNSVGHDAKKITKHDFTPPEAPADNAE